MDDDATLPPSVRDAPNNQSSAVAPAPCTSQLGDGTSVRRRPSVSAAVSRQLHSVVGAALARVAAPGPRPGNSCNSDNHRVIVGVKRKAATVGRPPMAPPQVARMAVVPSASSAGAAPLGGEPALTVEDAVSMVQQGLEMDAEVACDAVSTLSKASADGGVHGLVEVQGRLVVVHPGLSRASVGLSSRANA